jgi:6-phosphofructokinase 1
MGVQDGYAGLIAGDLKPLGSRDVGAIMQHGGTVLGSSRPDEFRTTEGRDRAVRQLSHLKVEGVVVIGGNGTQAGSKALSDAGVPVVGVASTVDNDVAGFDVTIGVDTALNVALEAIDRLKTTASSLGRAFLVEVMGREHGFLALMAGLSGGAEAICLPEVETSPDAVARQINDAYRRGKPHAIVVVAEGAACNGTALEQFFETHHPDLGFQVRLTKLGYVQRGGVPTFSDRLLGLQAGFEAATRLLDGEQGIIVGQKDGRIIAAPLKEIASVKKQLDTDLLRLAPILAM